MNKLRNTLLASGLAAEFLLTSCSSSDGPTILETQIQKAIGDDGFSGQSGQHLDGYPSGPNDISDEPIYFNNLQLGRCGLGDVRATASVKGLDTILDIRDYEVTVGTVIVKGAKGSEHTDQPGVTVTFQNGEEYQKAIPDIICK